MPALETFPLQQEELILQRFKSENPDLFKKSDARLFAHLGIVIGLLSISTAAAVGFSFLPLKILLGAVSAFFWFSLINVTIHHHMTHRNSASHPAAKKFLDILYLIAVPSGPKRKSRYARSHLNHHLRPFHETDVDHCYGTKRFLRMMQKPWSAFLYFLELTFIGGHVPGWEDDAYMNTVPLENWNQNDYVKLKKSEPRKAALEALWQWGAFLFLAFGLPAFGIRHFVITLASWGWIFPMLLVKNWAHFLGQFQHYDEFYLDAERPIWKKTKTYDIPGWLNYLASGEITGHFLHHLYPELPYYNVETARKRFISDPVLLKEFVVY